MQKHHEQISVVFFRQTSKPIELGLRLSVQDALYIQSPTGFTTRK